MLAKEGGYFFRFSLFFLKRLDVEVGASFFDSFLLYCFLLIFYIDFYLLYGYFLDFMVVGYLKKKGN